MTAPTLPPPSNPIVVIPARMASTRLPGKPLADILGAPMIVHVMRRALEAGIGPVVVACAEPEIARAVEAAGGTAVLTRPDHPSGSDRIFEALRLIDEDKRLCDAIARAGSALVKPGSRLLTHCNTGGLATAGVGTALGVIARAHQEGKVSNVWVDETRPLLQGGRLTAWELGELGVPYQLITDSMAASLMAKGLVDAVWVGADRIAANGDVANKIGTYSLAVLAKFHGIPFYVAAPQTTLDPDCPNGDAIPIEQRAASEVTGVAGSFGAVQWAPEDAQVYNPAFDVTPASLISGWVLDTGVVTPQEVANGKFA